MGVEEGAEILRLRRAKGISISEIARVARDLEDPTWLELVRTSGAGDQCERVA